MKTHFHIKTKGIALFLLIVIAAVQVLTVGCTKQKAQTDSKKIAVFVPGLVSGNPIYEMLVSGVKEAQKNCTVIEAGTNQAEWGTKLTALASSGKYGLIISSNPSIPEIAQPITKQFPQQKFVILDAYLSGNPQIATVRYNQREQSYLAGYIAGLITTSSMQYANPDKKIGLLAAQEYPVMNNIILPSFTDGARATDPEITVDFRLVGNWYDAAKGAELAEAMKKSGVDVILPIAGGASQGVIASAKESGFYITWFDDLGFNKAPGYVVSSSVLAQKKLAKELTQEYLNGTLAFGTAKTVGIKEGYVDFVTDDPNYLSTVPEDIRNKVSAVLADIRSGKLNLAVE